MNGYPFSGYNHTYWYEYKGDYYCILDDIGTAPPLFSPRRHDDGTVDTNSNLGRQRYRPGLMREFIDTSVLRGSWQAFDIYNVENGASYKYTMTGLTLPINAALFYGAKEKTQYGYKWQSNNGTWNNLDATTAVKLVTKEACAKLKEDYSDLRVYLIKYRRQKKYKHPVTQVETDFDYDYLNDCAKESSAPYLYEDVEDEAGLKSALDAIYTNIKEWAGHTEARNVNV